MTNILAIDPATTSGWAVLSIGMAPRLIDHGHRRTKTGALITFIGELVTLHGIRRAITERPYYNRVNAKTTIDHAALCGYWQMALDHHDVPWLDVPASQWQGPTIGGGARSDRKKAAQRLVKQVYHVDATQDEADAILLGRWAAIEIARGAL